LRVPFRHMIAYAMGMTEHVPSAKKDPRTYAQSWQDQVREAEAHMAAGRVRQFDCDDDFLARLEGLAGRRVTEI
jgi:hypothetical protein